MKEQLKMFGAGTVVVLGVLFWVAVALLPWFIALHFVIKYW